ncbi:hypothetical protein LTR70_010051 [Exophiala xenobiotica]|uniref:F-box domain-containing protein n=1 Tax=Lithohypha guttulata TaxID=1690604 RepID=A0ABR0JVD3_9EURO|nr:hypothetical protein LTR24_009972 [Lithohypha guttulata]KAK5309712.1 hypothetical protein LTR70_010051 [Exophiala xenobiotica]
MLLTELPTEILENVCWYLSREADFRHQHYEDASSEDNDNIRDDGESHSMNDHLRTDNEYDSISTKSETNKPHADNAMIMAGADNLRRSLLDLSLVSRRLHRLAEPYLYALFDQRSDKTFPFLRHIIDHPYHALHVRELRIEPFMEDWEWKCIGEDPDFTFTSLLLCKMLHHATTASGDFPASLASRLSLKSDEAQQEVIAQWLMLNLPNLEILRISIPEEWSFLLLKFIAQHDRDLFSSLRTLHILNPPTWQIKYGRRSTADLGLVMSILSLKRLETIIFDHCISFEHIEKLELHARHIAHWGCDQIACQINRLLSACTQLQSYDLEYNGGAALDISGLSRSKDSLHRLNLEVSDLALNSLTQCQTLKEIAITADRFDPRRPGTRGRLSPRVKVPEPPQHLLAAMLPASLESLRLGKTYGCAPSMWPDQLGIVVNNVARKFHNLKLVEVYWQPDRQLQEACASVDVQLAVLDDDVSGDVGVVS